MRSSGALVGVVGLATVFVAFSACHKTWSPDQPVTVPTNAVAFDPPARYPDIAWTHSLDEARAQAADEHKPMIVFVRAAWSKPSIVMDTTIWQDPRILAEAARFVALRIDLTQNYDGQIPDAYKDYDIRGVPTTIIVSSTGAILGRFGMGQARSAEIAAAMRDAK
jgi:thiol:disulfide interchange protein